ncbi:MAG: daunorubicin resistance transporter, inner rane subunit [Nitrospira sp.]|jgi:ABC-2 type transport system permease protein|nr:daunorubicin resistance transporter, inner rane subunit [Nitrospira sp.]
MNGVAAVFYRDYRQRLTNIAFVFWDLFVPMAYLFLFGVGLERTVGRFTIEGMHMGYTEFFLAGVLAMTTFGIAMNTSWGIFMDKDSGIFYELLTYPITRGQFLLGKICFNVLLSGIGCLLAIVLAAWTMPVTVRWAWLPVTLLVVMGTTAGWFFLFSILAVKLSRMDAFNTCTSAAYILLMFLSTMFYPMEQLPAWFRVLAWMNPMTWQVDVLRFTLLGVGSVGTILLECVGFTSFTLICLWRAVRAIDRAG